MRAPGTRAWLAWEFGSAPFGVLVLTVGFSTYFKEVVVEGAQAGDFLWGVTNSLSMAAVALTAPYAGAYADAARAKRLLLAAYTVLALVSTALLSTVVSGMVAAGMVLFILANIGFQGGQVFYNGFLPEIAPRERLGTVSGLGEAVGFVAILTALLLSLPFVSQGFATTGLRGTRGVFLLVAGFLLVFSLPASLRLHDRPASAPAGESRPSGARSPTFRESLSRLVTTFRHLRRYRGPFYFLLAYWLYMDAISTGLAFIGIYATGSLGLSLRQLVLIFAVSQLTAIPGSLVFGGIADRAGMRSTITWCLLFWLAIIVLGALAQGVVLATLFGLLSGLGIGALLTVSRSMMAGLAPPDQMAEFFGFYALVGRFSAVFGPLLFGAVSSLTGNQRLALLTLGLMIVPAVVLLQRVPELTPGQAAPQERAPSHSRT